MTRARRIHQGERTHSERRLDEEIAAKVAPATAGPRRGITVPVGETAELECDGSGVALDAVLWEGCKACAKVADAHVDDGGVHHVVKAPTGTEHLAETPQSDTTLCGREITEEWS